MLHHTRSTEQDLVCRIYKQVNMLNDSRFHVVPNCLSTRSAETLINGDIKEGETVGGGGDMTAYLWQSKKKKERVRADTRHLTHIHWTDSWWKKKHSQSVSLWGDGANHWTTVSPPYVSFDLVLSGMFLIFVSRESEVRQLSLLDPVGGTLPIYKHQGLTVSVRMSAFGPTALTCFQKHSWIVWEKTSQTAAAFTPALFGPWREV